jgi:tripartite-type tricarboxylate transporter receptor subunit TctC
MRLVRTVAVVTFMLGALAGAQSQSDYPNKPITLVLPLGAGGAMDILARGQFAPKLSERWANQLWSRTAPAAAP